MNISKSEIVSSSLGSKLASSSMDLLFDTEPFLILDSNCNTIFYNDAFKYSILYEYYIENDNFNNLKDDIKIFATTSFNFSSLNKTIPNNQSNQQQDYLISINRIKLLEGEFFLLKFSDVSKLIEREKRIISIQTALEMIKIPVLITSSNGNVLYVSEEFEKLFDLTLESIHNKFFCLAFEKVLSREEIFSLENSFWNNHFWSKTINLTDANGDSNYKEIKLFPSARLINGEKLSLVIVYDITAHIEKKNQAEAFAERLNSILDSISDPMFIIKDNENYLSLEKGNKSFYELFNSNFTNIGLNIEKILDKDLFNLIKTNVSLLKHTNDNLKDFEYSINGSFYKGKIVPLNTLNKDSIYVITLNNITKEIEYQNKIKTAYKKELDLNRLKSAFIENISHEIRTPFHAISGYSELLDDSLRNEDYGTVKEITSLLKDVLGRVTRLFDNLIELSQLESREMIFDFSNVNPNKIVKNVYESSVKRAIEKGIQLLLDLGDLKSKIRVDQNKLEKIISSLVDNSIKYTHYGNVVVRTYRQNQKVYIVVTDTGEGMNQSEIDDLLQPFSQGEDTLTRKYQGMGLGLTIAYRLTKLMGGDVEIVSQKSVGTKVVLSFNIIEFE